MELIHNKTWKPASIMGPEWFDPKPYLDLVNEYGAPWKMREEKV
jgi:hypothetical protein